MWGSGGLCAALRQNEADCEMERGRNALHHWSKPPYPVSTPLPCDVSKREATVIGAGVVGLSAALQLLRRNFSVDVIDELPAGEGASFGNSGFLVADTAMPTSLPGVMWKIPKWLADPVGPFALDAAYVPRALPWLLRFVMASARSQVFKSSKALRQLHTSTFEHWLDLVGPETFDKLIRRNGQIYVWEGEHASPTAGFEDLLRRRLGVEFETLGQDRIRQMLPGISPTIFKGLYIPGNGHTVNPGKLVKALAKCVLEEGGRLIHERVLKLTPQEGHGWMLFTNVANRLSSNVIIAGGAWSNRLLGPCGLSVPLETERGYHTLLPSPSIRLDYPVLHKSGSFGVNSMEMGLRLAGTVEIAGLDAPPTERRARHLVTQARRLFPDIEFGEPSFWLGHRPSLPDSLPVIGAFGGKPGLYGCFGHGHAGLTGGPASGHLVAQLVAGERPTIDPTPYSPARFGR
jgi:glycine/D-amino acid oxidase-like deaminating enzyme